MIVYSFSVFAAAFSITSAGFFTMLALFAHARARAEVERSAREERERIAMYQNAMLAGPRSIALLRSWLSAEQLAQFNIYGHFIAIGSESKRSYFIHIGLANNVVRDDQIRLCFGPRGGDLPIGDVMLAQKIMIENDEGEVLRVANGTPMLSGGIIVSSSAPMLFNTQPIAREDFT